MKKSYHLLNNLNMVFWSRVVGSTQLDVQSLCAFRLIACFFILVFYFPTFGWIDQVPRIFFNPPLLSFANIFNGFPYKGLLLVLDGLMLLCLFFVMIGIKARQFTILFVVLGIVGSNFQYSFGKIDHNILFYSMMLCMAFSGWGSALAMYPDRKPDKETTIKCLSLLSVLSCFGMFSAGIQKAHHWIDFDSTTNGFARWLYDAVFQHERNDFLAEYVLQIPFKYFEAFDYAAVVFEMSAFFFLITTRQAWKAWIFIACLFHLFNSLVLNIGFTANILPYLVFVNFTGLFIFFKNKFNKFTFKLSFLTMVLLIMGGRFYSILLQERHISIFNVFIEDHKIKIDLYFSILFWLVAGVLVAHDILRELKNKRKSPPKPVLVG